MLNISVVVGNSPDKLTHCSAPPFSSQNVEFLSELSSLLMKGVALRNYPDIASFAYWCRRGNLLRLQDFYGVRLKSRLGRGLAFHLAPANVPLNFAFSLAFGMLSGCSNVVRLPSKTSPQADIVCDAISMVLDHPRFGKFAQACSLVRYSINDQITTELSKLANVRVIWGGDDTVKKVRAMESSPRCIDIAFADRYSLCMLDAHALLDLGNSDFQKLLKGFFNDTFLLHQNACSSPHLVIWRGSKTAVSLAKDRFWRGLKNILDQMEEEPPIFAMEKFVHSMRVAVKLPDATVIRDQANTIYRVQLNKLPDDIAAYRGRYGFFFEASDEHFSHFISSASGRYQTVTYFGVDPTEIGRLVVQSGSRGIDRIVPVGRALDIGLVWDGYDIIEAMTRIVLVE